METTTTGQELPMLADPKLRMKVRKHQKAKARYNRDPASWQGVDFFVSGPYGARMVAECKQSGGGLSGAIENATIEAASLAMHQDADRLLRDIQVTLQVKHHRGQHAATVFPLLAVEKTFDLRDTFKLVLEHYQRVLVQKGIPGFKWIAPGLPNRFVHQIETEAYASALAELLGDNDAVSTPNDSSTDPSNTVVNLKTFRETRLPPAVGYEDPDDLTPSQLNRIRAAVGADVADIDLFDIEPF